MEHSRYKHRITSLPKTLHTQSEKATCQVFSNLLYYLDQLWVALQSLPQGMSATLPPLQGDKTLELEPPMKTILLFSILLCAIAMPAIGELTDADLDKIRLIVKEEVKTAEEEIKTEMTLIKSKIDGLDTRLRNVETNIAELRGRSIALSAIKDWGVALCALGALIVSIIALRKKQPKLPQTAQDAPKAASQ